MMIKLNIKQNALHSLHHAIELMSFSEKEQGLDGRSLDDDTHTVDWFEDGRLCFSLAEYTPPPPVYKLKFALLHLIQSAELILKAYIADIEPQVIFKQSKSGKRNLTINLHESLKLIEVKKPDLFSEGEKNLLLEMKNLRNDVEHHEFIFSKSKLKQLCVDFLALCAYLIQNLFNKNILELFNYDAIHDETDPVSDFLKDFFNGTSQLGRASLIKAGKLWAKNSDEVMYFCIYCRENVVSTEQDMCMGCGAENNKEVSMLIQDFEQTVNEYCRLKNLLEKKPLDGKVVPIRPIKK